MHSLVAACALFQGTQLPKGIEQHNIKLTWTERNWHIKVYSTRWVYDVTSICTHGYRGIPWWL